MCGRSCCKDCSEKRNIDWNSAAMQHKNKIDNDDLASSQIEVQGKIELTRICEYCEVKLDNP